MTPMEEQILWGMGKCTKLDEVEDLGEAEEAPLLSESCHIWE